jgi:hypothetical protein
MDLVRMMMASSTVPRYRVEPAAQGWRVVEADSRRTVLQQLTREDAARYAARLNRQDTRTTG